MKKVSLLVLLAIVASTLLMAAIPTTVVRLTIINKSGYDVYMKLEGSKITEAYYYLTVPSGTRDEPYVKVFTIMSDLYTRTTWQCNGVQSSGTLIVDGNIRLTFTPCGEKACSWVAATYQWWGCHKDQLTYVETTHRFAGEPRMEKVTYFKYLTIYPHVSDLGWNSAYLANGWFNFGCGTWVWRIRSYRLPYGCAWRYQY
jgi:hypothetical protein